MIEQASKGKQTYGYGLVLAEADLLRARRSTATALNGVAIVREGTDKAAAYAAANEAVELWPEQPQLRANRDRLQPADLRRLAGLVWEGGPDEIERFVAIAISDQPFPI